jgi:hypothetical protein
MELSPSTYTDAVEEIFLVRHNHFDGGITRVDL